MAKREGGGAWKGRQTYGAHLPTYNLPHYMPSCVIPCLSNSAHMIPMISPVDDAEGTEMVIPQAHPNWDVECGLRD